MTISLLALSLGGCLLWDTQTTYSYHPETKQWYKSECHVSDKEYRLWDQQYHCESYKVSAMEAKFMHR